jgi:hypothetical protein
MQMINHLRLLQKKKSFETNPSYHIAIQSRLDHIAVVSEFCRQIHLRHLPFEKMEKSIYHVTTEKVSNHIPHDLEFFIVSKLPIKSLKRFSCVRKSWSLLFQNSNFMNMYRNYFISSNHSSYEKDGSCLLLQQTLSNFPNHHVLYLISGETFENKVKGHLHFKRMANLFLF